MKSKDKERVKEYLIKETVGYVYCFMWSEAPSTKYFNKFVDNRVEMFLEDDLDKLKEITGVAITNDKDKQDFKKIYAECLKENYNKYSTAMKNAKTKDEREDIYDHNKWI